MHRIQCAVWAVHRMHCTAQTGGWLNLKEVAQTTNFCGTTSVGITIIEASQILFSFCFIKILHEILKLGQKIAAFGTHFDTALERNNINRTSADELYSLDFS